MAPTVIERGSSPSLVIPDRESPGITRLGVRKYTTVEANPEDLGHYVGRIVTTRITAAITRQQEIGPSQRGPLSIGGGSKARWLSWPEVLTLDEEICLRGPKEGIDDPEFRVELAEATGIRLEGEVPERLLTEAAIVLGNYPGWGSEKDSRHLLPSIHGLLFFVNLISRRSEKNRLLAVAREGALRGLPRDLVEMLSPAIIEAKRERGRYHLGLRESWKMRGHLRREGVLWIAPGATTREDGLVFDLRTGGVRAAEEGGYRLYVLAMKTVGEGEERRVRAIQVKEISMPEIICRVGRKKEKQLRREANRQITCFAMAELASCLPYHLRGEFKDCEGIQDEVIRDLEGMEDDGLLASGGFLD